MVVFLVQSFHQHLHFSLAVPRAIRARGSAAELAYRKALKEGKTRDRRIPLMLIVSARSGKTSLKRSLAGQKFLENQASTEVVDCDPSLCKIENDVWRVCSDGKNANQDGLSFFQHQAAVITLGNAKRQQGRDVADSSIKMEPKSFKFQTKNPTSSFKPLQAEANQALVDESATKELKEILNDDESVSNTKETQPVPHSKEDTNLQTTILKSKQNVLEYRDDCTKIIEKLLSESDQSIRCDDIFFTTWDFAGQSLYYTTHRLFMSRRAVYLLTYDLTQNLHDKAKPETTQGICKKRVDSASNQTNMDILEFWMSSVSFLNRDAAPRSETSKQRLTPVIFVGTHHDKEEKGESKHIEVASEIHSSLKKKPYGEHLSERFFLVDNTKAGNIPEDKEVKELRKTICEVVKDFLDDEVSDVPLRWYEFEGDILKLRESGLNHMKLEQIEKFAHEAHGINDKEELTVLLEFLDHRKIIIHLKDTKELEELIILNPQWLIDVIKNVITLKPYKEQDQELKDKWSVLEKEACLSKEFAEHILKKEVEEERTAETLLAIMEKFHLIFRYPELKDEESKGRYLVPSLLFSPLNRNAESGGHMKSNTSLVVNFDAHPVPEGLFYNLVFSFTKSCAKYLPDCHFSGVEKNSAHFILKIDEYYIYILVLTCSMFTIEANVQQKRRKSDEQTQGSTTIDRLASFCHPIAKFLQNELEKINQEMEGCSSTLKFNFGVPCTATDHPKCEKHGKENCSHYQCWHIFDEEKLMEKASKNQPMVCHMTRNVVEMSKYAAWFPSLHKVSLSLIL